MKVLVSLKDGSFHYYKGSGDFHCKEGMIKEEEVNSGKTRLQTQLKRDFMVFNASNYDFSQTIKRGPQWIMPKDIGYVIVRTGLDKHSKIVEAGAGSGAATIYFSRVVQEVLAYEVVEKHAQLVQKNLDALDAKNVKLIHADLKDEIAKLKGIDLLFLDMPEPLKVMQEDISGLKSGHFIVCYLPSINQVQEVATYAIEQDGLYLEEVSEVIVRNWKVSNRVARPESRKEVDHTAFLVFIRKL